MDGQRLITVIGVGTLLWPLLLASAMWASPPERAPVWSAVVYTAASRVCHQKPERSFHTAGIPWPVCARCSGLYLGAAAGVLAGLAVLRRRPAARLPLFWFALAAVPTSLTIGLEWLGFAGIGNVSRFLAALPLGGAAAAAVIAVVAEARQPFGYTGRA